MSQSRFEYVRLYEQPDAFLPNTFLVLRIDGHAFHKFSDMHSFRKPNDERALRLMDRAGRAVMEEYTDIVLGFGESDEFSFLIRRASPLYSRRASKLVSLLTSLFTSAYVYHWSTFFPPEDECPLKYPPSFDGRVVAYPTEREVRDYFSWRQADTHINNLYNTTFWSLVQLSDPPLSTSAAHAVLKGSVSKDKNEILFSRFNINYSKLDARFRRGSVLVREDEGDRATDTPAETHSGAAVVDPLEDETAPLVPNDEPEPVAPASLVPPRDDNLPTQIEEPSPRPSFRPRTNRKKTKPRPPRDGTQGHLVVVHDDLIKDAFWLERPWLLR